MAEQPPKREKLLSDAGGFLIAAGAVAAFTGGAYGLAQQRPGIILWTVVLLMGYGIVGYLLMNRGARSFHFALPSAAVLVVGTLLLFQSGLRGVGDDEFGAFILHPVLTLLLVYAGGALGAYVLEETTPRVSWPARGTGSLWVLLHLAAITPIWSAFALLRALGLAASTWDSVIIVGASAAVAILCVMGAHAARRQRHPGWTVLGAGMGFLAAAAYLFQFMSGMRGDSVYLGQFLALLGLIFSAIPVTMGVVAWIQVAQQDGRPPEPSAEEPPAETAQ